MDVTIEAIAAEMSKQLSAATNELNHQARLNMEELKTHVTLAAEGYGGTLERIERELVELKTEIKKDSGNHDLILKSHNERITALEEHC